MVLRVGTARYRYPAHQDHAANCLLQLLGSKRVVLTHPEAKLPVTFEDLDNKRARAEPMQCVSSGAASPSSASRKVSSAARSESDIDGSLAGAGVDDELDGEPLHTNELAIAAAKVSPGGDERAVGYECTLEAGDMLLIPPNWWHEVESRHDLSIATNYFFE